MQSVSQPETPVNPPSTRFRRNCDQARRAGYNLRVGEANVYTNGKPVDRELFETLHPICLLSLLDSHIGRRGRQAV